MWSGCAATQWRTTPTHSASDDRSPPVQLRRIETTSASVISRPLPADGHQQPGEVARAPPAALEEEAADEGVEARRGVGESLGLTTAARRPMLAPPMR